MPEKTLFLAEGEKHVREALRLSLEQQDGISVIGEAAHAESLLAQVCQHPPDAILLDLNLPGLHLRRLLVVLEQYCPGTQILACSVWPQEENNWMEIGVDGILSKLLPPDKFIEQLLKLMA